MLASFIGLAFLLSACASTNQVKPVQPHVTGALLLGQSHTTLGQTITTRFDGLDGIYIHLAPGEAGSGSINLHLRANRWSSQDIRTASIPVNTIRTAEFYRFAIDRIDAAKDRDFFLELEIEGNGSVFVGHGPPEAYVDGSLYVDRVPQPGQLAFLLDYDTPRLAVGLVFEGLTWLAWLLVAIVVYILPGWALADALWPDWIQLRWAEKLGLASGIGLAFYPMLLLWSDQAGLQLARGNAWLPISFAILWLGWRYRHSRVKNLSTAQLKNAIQVSTRNGDLALVGVILLMIFTRFWAIREVELPMWHDSYQHAVIVQRLVDQGGLFTSWEPYSPYHSLSVHFGFHAQAAALSWLVGIDGARATLLFGQMANVLAILGLMPLALRFGSGSRWSATGALIAAGLVSTLPAFYVNWGRFPQLAGQAILPVACWMTMMTLSNVGKRILAENVPSKHPFLQTGTLRTSGAIVLCSLTLAGMLLTYYRTAYAFVTLIAAVWAMGWAISHFRLNWLSWAGAAILAALIAGASFVMLAPWLKRTSGTHLSTVIESGIGQGVTNANVVADLQSWVLLPDYLDRSLWVFIAAAVLWGIWRRRWEIPMLVVWIGLWIAYFLGRVIGLPGANLISNFSIMIALYIPAGLLCGWLAGEILDCPAVKKRPIIQGFLGMTLMLVAFVGANAVRSLTSPSTHALVTRPDLRAMDWIRSNVPEDARFLVESYRIYNGSTAVGADAGWWIPLLTLRENSMPPQYALMNEVPQPPGYSRAVVELIAGLEQYSPGSPEGISLLCNHGITHVYIGQQQGKIGFEAKQLFSPEDFRDSKAFEIIYHQDQVYIFALTPQACAGRAANP